jgi:hypothetical protein
LKYRKDEVISAYNYGMCAGNKTKTAVTCSDDEHLCITNNLTTGPGYLLSTYSSFISVCPYVLTPKNVTFQSSYEQVQWAKLYIS